MGRRKIKFKPINLKEIPSLSAATEKEVFPPWIDLPLDLTANIMQRLGQVEILRSANKVCATWRKVCEDPAMWRVINIINPDQDSIGECTNMCRRAVDRSQGQLIDLTIAYFGHDELLDYIVLRSKYLRRLTLACCYKISGTALARAVQKLPELEELHLFIPSIQPASIETIGISCPKLRSFTLNQRRWRIHRRLQEADESAEILSNNDDALAIAKSMPNLYNLRLFANYLNNEGLEAILDGCPRLESLDLRQCSGVDLVGALGIRCCEQIKHLRLPFDSFDDEDECEDARGVCHYSSSPYSSTWVEFSYHSRYYGDYYTDAFRYDYGRLWW